MILTFSISNLQSFLKRNLSCTIYQTMECLTNMQVIISCNHNPHINLLRKRASNGTELPFSIFHNYYNLWILSARQWLFFGQIPFRVGRRHCMFPQKPGSRNRFLIICRSVGCPARVHIDQCQHIAESLWLVHARWAQDRVVPRGMRRPAWNS